MTNINQLEYIKLTIAVIYAIIINMNYDQLQFFTDEAVEDLANNPEVVESLLPATQQTDDPTDEYYRRQQDIIDVRDGEDLRYEQTGWRSVPRTAPAVNLNDRKHRHRQSRVAPKNRVEQSLVDDAGTDSIKTMTPEQIEDQRRINAAGLELARRALHSASS